MSKLVYKEINKKEISLLKFLDKTGEESDVSKFFSNRFEKLFPKLQLFHFGENKETRWKYKEGENRGEFDAISWYPEANTFIIFEYKVSKDKLLDQVYKYLNALKKEKYGKLKNDLIEILNKNFPNKVKGWWSISDVDWEKLKVICLATEFYEWQNSLSVPDERIVWVKMEWYGVNDNENENVIILEGEDKNFLFLEKLTEKAMMAPIVSKGEKPKESKPISLLQLLKKIKPNEEIKKWSEKIHETLVREYFLVPKTYFYEGSGWKGIDYNIKDSIKDFSLFWVNISKKVFRIYFPRTPSSNLKELVERYKLQEKPTVFYWIVEDEDSFSKSIIILREFLSRRGI